MTVLTREFAERFAEEWFAAWNARDLDRVLQHYRDDFVFHSPLIANVTNESSGRLSGRASVRAYWEAALARIAELRMEQTDLLVGADTLTLYYRGPRGMAAETFFFDEAGKVRLATACYAS